MTRVLLVEDEESLRITLSANLELEDFDVVEAADGQEALEALATQSFDLILSDIRMPKLGGVDLLQQVKEKYPDTPVVLMTAYAQEAQIERAITEGVHAVLKKPFDFDEAALALTAASKNRAVLVVDDDKADAETLAETLRLSGVRARVVFSGEDALQVMNQGEVDVCVTDLVMPGTNGVALAEKARTLDESVTVIVCSGHDVPQMVRQVNTLGVFACMRKPLSPDELLRTIAKARGGPCAL